jgi:hypothetical protein
MHARQHQRCGGREGKCTKRAFYTEPAMQIRPVAPEPLPTKPAGHAATQAWSIRNWLFLHSKHTSVSWRRKDPGKHLLQLLVQEQLSPLGYRPDAHSGRGVVLGGTVVVVSGMTHAREKPAPTARYPSGHARTHSLISLYPVTLSACFSQNKQLPARISSG